MGSGLVWVWETPVFRPSPNLQHITEKPTCVIPNVHHIAHSFNDDNVAAHCVCDCAGAGLLWPWLWLLGACCTPDLTSKSLSGTSCVVWVRPCVGGLRCCVRDPFVQASLTLHSHRVPARRSFDRISRLSYDSVVVTVKTCAREKSQGSVGEETGVWWRWSSKFKGARPGRRFRQAEPQGIR